jgi:hypothetical protein
LIHKSDFRFSPVKPFFKNYNLIYQSDIFIQDCAAFPNKGLEVQILAALDWAGREGMPG